MMFGATACSDDEKDDITPSAPTENVDYGKWIESGNQLKYTNRCSGEGFYFDMAWTLEFDDKDLCTFAECAYIFSNEQLADASYQEMMADETMAEYDIKKSGKSIIVNFTKDFKGFEKSIAKMLVETMSNI